MNIIKDQNIIEDNWTHLSDDDNIPATGNISVTLTRWQQNKTKLASHDGQLGIRLAPTDHVEDIAEDIEQMDLIAVEFPVFTDGRSFSQIRLLRSRYRFTGEIRAMGHYIADQAFYLYRVGVNAFASHEQTQLDLILKNLHDFSVSHQPSSN